MWKIGMLTALLATAGCATLKSNKTVCPEYRDLRCATAPECSMDYPRGCQVCQCTSGKLTPEGEVRTHVPPDRN